MSAADDVIRLRFGGLTHSACWDKLKFTGASCLRTTCRTWFANQTELQCRVDREETVTCVRCVVQVSEG